MPEQIGHHCGVVAVVDLLGKRDIVPDALRMALELQHRGQLAWGRAGFSLKGDVLWSKTERGLVRQTLDEALKIDAPSASVIAHTRYATNLCLGMAHPVVIVNPEAPERSIAFAFNGNIPDTSVQSAGLRDAGVGAGSGSDTEVLACLLASRLKNSGLDAMKEAVRSLGECDGAMNGVVLAGDGGVAAFRDRHGFHPLVYAVHDNKFAVASEDHAIHKVWPNCTDIQPVAPGEIIMAAPGSAPRRERLWEAEPSHCFFEATYFAKRFSTLDGTPVHRARYLWGEVLADVDAHCTEKRLVIPVPDSAKIAAQGYADRSGQRYVDLMLRNSEERTFIAPNERDQRVIEKFDIDPGLVDGKHIVLVEDSVVRGTTMRSLVHRIRSEARPASIHLRIACPPILHPCYYGIDFSTRGELLVPKHTTLPLQEDGTLPLAVLDAIARDLQVDSIRYLPLPAVAQALQKSFHHLCTACITGRYPTEAGRKLHALSMVR